MSNPSPQTNVASRWSILFLTAVIGVAVVGYFAGINDGVPREDTQPSSQTWLKDYAAGSGSAPSVGDTIPAISYSQMRRTQSGPTSRWKPALDRIPQPPHDLFAEIKPSEEAKRQSTLTRAARRAFNGAPPIIPHAVEQTDDAACYACHGQGMRIGDRVANRMSHVFLANCTQCHAPPPPKPFADTDASVETTFVGLPAPLKGERAYPGAPPTIPHSTWMRESCLACHGNESGWAGLESTHPWRIACQQCHAASAALEQGVDAAIEFVPPLDVDQP